MAKDWLKFILWAASFSVGVTLLLCAPLIWQWLKSIPATSPTDPEIRKWFEYLLLLVAGKWLLIDPIADKLKDIAWEMKEFNQRERLK